MESTGGDEFYRVVRAALLGWWATSERGRGIVTGRSPQSLGSTNMPGFDPDGFLNRKHFAFSFGALIGDVEDFLDFSERNIEWQRHSAIQAIRRMPDLEGFPEGYLDHLLANAEHRFTTSLPMRLRYASLVSLVTTVEWETRILGEYAAFPITAKPTGVNNTVHILRSFESHLTLEAGPTIDDYERIVFVRNVISHNAGVVPSCDFEDQLRAAIKHLSGFSIVNWHFVGECVKIEKGALNTYIRAMTRLLPQIWEEADRRGKVKQ